ncbi:MAG: hypothetical protein MHMPM18_000190 [Marteilia pararefringens]
MGKFKKNLHKATEVCLKKRAIFLPKIEMLHNFMFFVFPIVGFFEGAGVFYGLAGFDTAPALGMVCLLLFSYIKCRNLNFFRSIGNPCSKVKRKCCATCFE